MNERADPSDTIDENNARRSFNFYHIFKQFTSQAVIFTFLGNYEILLCTDILDKIDQANKEEVFWKIRKGKLEAKRKEYQEMHSQFEVKEQGMDVSTDSMLVVSNFNKNSTFRYQSSK